MSAHDPFPLASLLDKHGRAGPRYTSYPPASEFHDAVGPNQYAAALEAAGTRVDNAWSLYVHVPFCRSRCDFCACAVIPTKMHDRVAPNYVRAVLQELAVVRSKVGQRDSLAEVHLGGGTPTYLAPELLAELLAGVFERFSLASDVKLSAEVDPRVTTQAHLDVLAEHGFNRLSLGVQDLDPRVQEAIGRHQSAAQTSDLLDAARARGLSEFNVDLVYGLPHQTSDGLRRTIDTVIAAGITRAAVYGYAHVPWMRPNQKRLPIAALPDAPARLALAATVRETFEAAGFVAIGLDHYARPDDELALAAKSGELTRNFMGYTVRAGADTLGVGLTAIGDVDGVYVQNTPKLARYLEACERGEFSTVRGRARNRNDELRRAIIHDLMCQGRVSRDDIASRFRIDFEDVLAEPLQRLRPLLDDGVVLDDGETLRLHDEAGPLLRNVAMAFDAYLEDSQGRFSSTA